MNPAHRRSLCQAFIEYLRENPQGTLRLDLPETWLPNAIRASGGAGNPTGAVIAIDAPAVEPVRCAILAGIDRLASEATVSQDLFDLIFFGTLEAVVREVGSGSPATNFTFGRAQKLITIYLKILYVAFWGEYRDTDEAGRPPARLGRWSGCLHIPVDRQTITFFDTDQPNRHLTRIGPKLRSWKWDLDRVTYLAFQALARKQAAAGHYLDPMHFEMDCIWTQPTASGGSSSSTISPPLPTGTPPPASGTPPPSSGDTLSQ